MVYIPIEKPSVSETRKPLEPQQQSEPFDALRHPTSVASALTHNGNSSIKPQASRCYLRT